MKETIDKFFLMEMKLMIQEEYMAALETQNSIRASFLRGKLCLIEELLKNMKKE